MEFKSRCFMIILFFFIFVPALSYAKVSELGYYDRFTQSGSVIYIYKTPCKHDCKQGLEDYQDIAEDPQFSSWKFFTKHALPIAAMALADRDTLTEKWEIWERALAISEPPLIWINTWDKRQIELKKGEINSLPEVLDKERKQESA